MLVEVVVLLVLEVMGTNENIIAEAGSFISKICMLLFSVLLDRYTRKNDIYGNSVTILYHNSSSTGK